MHMLRERRLHPRVLLGILEQRHEVARRLCPGQRAQHSHSLPVARHAHASLLPPECVTPRLWQRVHVLVCGPQGGRHGGHRNIADAGQAKAPVSQAQGRLCPGHGRQRLVGCARVIEGQLGELALLELHELLQHGLRARAQPDEPRDRAYDRVCAVPHQLVPALKVRYVACHGVGDRAHLLQLGSEPPRHRPRRAYRLAKEGKRDAGLLRAVRDGHLHVPDGHVLGQAPLGPLSWRPPDRACGDHLVLGWGQAQAHGRQLLLQVLGRLHAHAHVRSSQDYIVDIRRGRHAGEPRLDGPQARERGCAEQHWR